MIIITKTNLVILELQIVQIPSDENDLLSKLHTWHNADIITTERNLPSILDKITAIPFFSSSTYLNLYEEDDYQEFVNLESVLVACILIVCRLINKSWNYIC